MAHGRIKYDLTQIGLRLEDGDAIKLGVVGSEDLVVYIGNVADGADSGYAPGSIALDTTDGLLFSCDSAGLWQQMALA